MWLSAITFTKDCLSACFTWFHGLMAAAGVTDGTILGFFAALGVATLIIGPIRGKALGSDSVRLHDVAINNSRRANMERELNRYGGDRP